MPKRRPNRSPKREQPHRTPRLRVLIVCEGRYTEPNYFQALRVRLRLETLVVKGTDGADPRRLVAIAGDESRKEKRHGEQFDYVYCVFDRDDHSHFQEASETAKDRGFQLARSWPCFEYWLLLHFRYSRAPYMRTENLSPCDACIRDLREYLPHYRKGDDSTFDDLWNLLDTAMEHARKALADAKETREENPSTEVHELIERLQGLR